ncbi:MAG: flagellar filament capping protein FliD [Deltaproteobacteria bacterium]|jgi:flagellar hook-associated protein 2|nr:flagellar filament capping protein FliD [Deltaproteobacteria bacterium]
MSSTTGIISGGIKWTGLASGTDFGAVVDKLVAIESRTITRQETWKAEWQAKITAISGLNTRLVSLKLDAQDKDIYSEMLSRTTSISQEGVVSVQNTSTASLGSYEVTVGENIVEKFVSRSYLETKTLDYSATKTGDLEITLGDPNDPSSLKTFVFKTTDDPTYPADGNNYILVDHADATLQKLMDDINAVTETEGIVASIIVDKTRSEGEYKRLVLTATEGGSTNRITVVNDPTDLNLGETYIDKPVYSTYLGSDVEVSTAGSTYTGSVNKTFTFVPSASGIIGTDAIEIQWADTEGHSGKFTIAQGYAGESIEIMQGLALTFDVGSGTGRFIQNEAFTIDCQAPILQKGQDSGLAQTEKVVHTGFVDQVSPINSGKTAKFIYSYQGIEHTVTVTDGMSLNLLANAINDASDNPGVTATVINDGTGTATAYHLILTGYHTGAESTITIIDPEDTDDRISSGLFSADTFSKSREATNAMVKVDGFPSGNDNWLQRSGNDVADVIDGVVMTVTGVGKTVLNVRNDSQAMADKITQLINSVNYCKTYILENTKWGESDLEVTMDDSGQVVTSRENANGVMIGNYGFQIAQSNLDKLMYNSIVPFAQDPSLTTKERIEKRDKFLEENGLVYYTLSQIGITSDPDNQGLYKVEESTLLECINTNPEAVIKLFTFEGEFSDKNAEGKDIIVQVKGIALDMGEQMAKITSDTDITDDEGNITQKGKGILVTLQENYEAIIENINAKIAREERRIEQVRQRLTDKFNRLEVSLQSLEDQQSKLESSIESLSSSSS